MAMRESAALLVAPCFHLANRGYGERLDQPCRDNGQPYGAVLTPIDRLTAVSPGSDGDCGFCHADPFPAWYRTRHQEVSTLVPVGADAAVTGTVQGAARGRGAR